MEFTLQNNNKIANFMELTPGIEPFTYRIDKKQNILLKFNDWNKLHQVIDQIEYLGYKVTIFDTQCQIDAIWDENYEIIWEMDTTKFEATYNAILKFIEKYDNSPKKRNSSRDIKNIFK